MRTMHLANPWLAVCALSLLGDLGMAHASDAGENAEAARLFEEAKLAMDQGNFARACPLLARSQALDPQVGTMLNLAWCYEHVGKTASAWSMWLDAAVRAASQAELDRERFARARASLLEPRLLRVTVSVREQPGADGLRVQLDGVPLPKAQWGVPVPLDPGEHAVEASAAGKRPWGIAVDVSSEHVPAVTIPVLAADPVRDPWPPAPAGSGISPWRIAAAAEAGAALAAAGTGALFSVMAKKNYDDSRPFCAVNGNNCDDQGRADRSRAFSDANVATVALGVSGCALLGAAVVWFSAPRLTGAKMPGAKYRGFDVSPTVTARDWSLALRKEW